MKIKTDENGAVSLSKDGHPIYVKDTGEEVEFNPEYYMKKVETYERKKSTQEKTQEKSQVAMVEELRSQLAKQDQEIASIMLDNSFSTSTVLKDTILPPQVARKYFEDKFKLMLDESTGTKKVVGFDGDSPILSKKTPGEIASFDEALSILMEKDPNNKSFMRAPASGMGVNSINSGMTPDINISKLSVKEKIALKDKIGAERYKTLVSKSSK